MPCTRDEMLGSLLKSVSRSFYLTLRILPSKIRPQIGLAYLLARTTDTIADTELVSVELRLEALRRLRDRIQSSRPTPLNFGDFTRHQASPSEARLLERCDDSLSILNSLTPADQKRVQEVLDIITSGQEQDLTRFEGASVRHIIALQNERDLDDYTYRV